MSIFLNSVFILFLSALVILSAYSGLNAKSKEEKKDFPVKINNSISNKTEIVSTIPPVKEQATKDKTNPIISPNLQQTAPASTPKIQTFSTSVSYSVPDSSQSMDVTVTVSGKIITNVSISQSMNGGKSRGYQQRFQDSYKSSVIGKDINSVNLSRVAGASLTTNAFMNAIKSIRAQVL